MRKNRTVAIKQLLHLKSSNPKIFSYVFREIYILRKLSSMINNFHTVKLLDIVASEDLHTTDQPYIYLVLSYHCMDLEQFLD